MLREIDEQDIVQLRTLNRQLFPVNYTEKFYYDLLYTHPKSLSRLAFDRDGSLIGAICCRKEMDVLGGYRIYIMTLGVLDRFRRLGVASRMLEEVEHAAAQDPSVERIVLHVHTGNFPAISFYERHQFRIIQTVKGYYNRNTGVDPPDAYFLSKPVIVSGDHQ